MTAPQAQLSDVDVAQRPYTYTGRIPLLRDLLPKQHGRPGITYAQVCLVNERHAQDEKWRRIEGTVVYTIVGPKGHADMVLMGKGKPVPGVSHASGKRRCYIDIGVEQLTGLPVKSQPLITNGGPTNAGRPVESKSQATSEGRVEGRKGDARV